MKFCNKCGTNKPLEEFGKKASAKDGRQNACKPCARAYAKKHYGENVDYYKEKSGRANEVATERNKQYVIDYLEAHPCIDCGETDIEVLQFDHIEMVGNSARRVCHFINCSLERLKEEIAKCEIRCANCHVRRTRRQTGLFRSVRI